MDVISVYKCRLRMGDYLAKKILNIALTMILMWHSCSRYVCSAIHGLSPRCQVQRRVHKKSVYRSNVHHAWTEVRKNRFAALNAIPLNLRIKMYSLSMTQSSEGQRVKIIRMARDAGAKKVYLLLLPHRYDTQMFMVLICLLKN